MAGQPPSTTRQLGHPHTRTTRRTGRARPTAGTRQVPGHLFHRRLEPASDAELADVMARLVAGDPQAMLDLLEVAWAPVRGIMDRTLRDAGFPAGAELLDDATLNGVLDLLEHPGGWRADGGAKPWNWAALRLRRVAFEVLGQVADELPEEDGGGTADDRPGRWQRTAAIDTAPPVDELPVEGRELSTFERLRHTAGLPLGIDAALARRIVDGLLEVASERHAEAWLEVYLEKCNGNTEAAVTVSTLLDLTPANVRQIDRRVTGRLTRRHGVSPYDTDLSTLFTPSA